MKITDTFDYQSPFDEERIYKNCRFCVDRYKNNNNLALWVEDCEGDEIVTCSVNGEKVCGDDEIGIKSWSENQGVVDFLVKLGIIDELTDVRSSGYVNIHYYRLTESGKELFKDVDKK